MNASVEREPFRHGHVHRHQPCTTCGGPTRRTVTIPRDPQSGRYVLCSRCKLPDAETRLLMAVFNVPTMPELDAAMRSRPMTGAVVEMVEAKR